jgi:hypothetical protein
MGNVTGDISSWQTKWIARRVADVVMGKQRLSDE